MSYALIGSDCKDVKPLKELKSWEIQTNLSHLDILHKKIPTPPNLLLYITFDRGHVVKDLTCRYLTFYRLLVQSTFNCPAVIQQAVKRDQEKKT